MDEEILNELRQIRELLERVTDNSNFTYSVVKIQDDEVQFSASLAQLADNGFEFVDIVHKQMGAYQVLVKRKNKEGNSDPKRNKDVSEERVDVRRGDGDLKSE